MTKLPLIVAALALVATGALAAKPIANPPTQAQLDAFYTECITVAPQAVALCKCKETAAPKLIDTTFMDIVIASMKGKPLDAKYYDAYNNYIAGSNKVCKPQY